MLNVLVACEESQRVTICMRELGIEAYSCDLLPCSGGYPEWHIQGDVRNYLNEPWDLVIAFPPCTHLAVSGNRTMAAKKADGRQQEAIDFFMMFVNCKAPSVAIENPVGIMSTVYRKPDQIIDPYDFGEPVRKRTCLWLKNLPQLYTTKRTEPPKRVVLSTGKRISQWAYDMSYVSAAERAKERSKTFWSVARVMATQWGGLLNATQS